MTATFRTFVWRWASVLLPLALAGCAFPGLRIGALPERLTVLPGSSATTLLDAVVSEQCEDQPGDLPCADIAGRILDYHVPLLPVGITVTIDTSLQSPSTPDIVRLTFGVAPDAAPGDYEIVVLVSVDGVRLGHGIVHLQVLPLSRTRGTAPPLAIAAGGGFSMALLADGTVWAWGRNDEAQLGLGSAADQALPVRIPGLSDVVAIAAGTSHSLALVRDGTVLGWGSGYAAGAGGIGATPSPTPVPGLTGVRAIAAGERHSLALRSDGTVWAWGVNTNGQIGAPTPAGVALVPVQVQGLPGVEAIAAGSHHSLALGADGTVWFWGHSLIRGEDSTSIRVPEQVPGLVRIRAIATGAAHALALGADGRVLSWGSNNAGQLGEGSQNDRPVPQLVPGLDRVDAIAAGEGHSVALVAGGGLWTWGHGDALGHSGGGLTTLPERVMVGIVRAVSTTHQHTLALLGCGNVWAWGVNYYGALGDSTRTGRAEPLRAVGDRLRGHRQPARRDGGRAHPLHRALHERRSRPGPLPAHDERERRGPRHEQRRRAPRSGPPRL
jgi:alpha-tubulin suppressor-like RCC1 family protein